MAPSTMVSTRPHFSPSRSPSSSAWCAQVTVVPEVSSSSVLNSGRCQGLNSSTPGRRPDAAGRGDAGNLLGAVVAEEEVEIGPEPGDEEHHLGGDEQDHAVAVMHLHDRGVVAAVIGLGDDVRPPGEHGVKDADEAGQHQPDRQDVVHPQDRADRRHEGGNRHPRPARGSD